MIVCKFGGTATTALSSIKNIQKLSRNKKRKVFVFSAIGKQNNQDIKITDLLIEYSNCKNKNKLNYILNKIEYKFNQLLKLTNQKINIKKELIKILKIYKQNKSADYLISRGEYLTSKIMSGYLNIKFIPAEKIIYFKNNLLNEIKIKNKLNYYLSKHKQIIVPGFYGVDENKNIKLFSRGGSDISGAIISKLINAKIYENWTDVNGVMQINPQISQSKQIPRLNYLELDIITSLDAKVIHNDCVKVLKNTNIKLYVKNIFNPKSKPTKVYKKCKKINMFIGYKILDDNVEVVIRHKSGYKGIIECSKSNYKSIIHNLYKISC